MPALIGTRAEAAIACTINQYNLPEGWSFAGIGCSRVAFRSPSGVIYKRCSGYDKANATEHKVASKLRKRSMPEGWAIPMTSLFRVNGQQILAMQDCGDDSKMPPVSYEFSTKWFGVFDPHYGNVRIKDGICYFIDFGFADLRKTRAKKKPARADA